METEVVTPEPSAVEKMEEVKQVTGDQPGTIISKSSLGEVQEVEDGHSKHAGTFESSRSTKEFEETPSLVNGVENPNKEGQVGNLESDSFSGSPSLAKKTSEEILTASQEIEDKDTPVLIHAEGLENGNQIQKEQTGEVVEATGDAAKGNSTDAIGKETETSFENARVVSTEQNDDVNITENLPTVPITTSLCESDLQKGNAEDGSEVVLDNIEQKRDALFDDKQSKTVGNSGRVTDDPKEEDESDDTEGKNSSKESDILSIEQNIANNVEAKAYEKEENTDISMESPILVKEGEKQPGLHEEETRCKEKSTILDSMVEGHEVILPADEVNSKEKEGDENTEHVLESLPEKTNFEHQNGDAENNFPITEDTGGLQDSKTEEKWSPHDISSHSLEGESAVPIELQNGISDENVTEPETQDKNILDLIERDQIKEEKVPEQSEIEQKDIQELAPLEVHKDLDTTTNLANENKERTSTEQVNEGSKIVETRDEGESDSKEDDYTVKDLIPVSHGEQAENECVKENNVAENPKEEVNDELLIIGDEHNEKQDKEENMIIEEPSTESSEDKNEVIEGLENAGPDKETGEHIIEKNIVPEYTRTSIEREPTEDSHEKDKVIEGQKIVSADKDIGHPIIEEAIVLDHSTITNGDEPIKIDQEDDKVINGSATVGEDKDINKHIIDNDSVQNHSKATSDKEPHKDGHEEEETREPDIASATKDANEPTVEEEPLEDGHEEKKVTEGSQIFSVEDTGENIVEEGHSEISTVGKPFEEGQEDEKVIEEQETTGLDKDNKEPLIEELVVSDHSTTIVEDKTVEDGHEENKVTGESQVVGKEDTGGAILEKVNALDRSETALTEGHKEEKETEELDIASGDNSIDEPILEEVVPNHSASTRPVEAVEESYEEEVVDKDIGEIINVEDVIQDTSKTKIGEERIQDNDNEDKAIKKSEISGADEDIIETITGVHVAQDNYTTILEGSQEESKESGGSQSLNNIGDTSIVKDNVPDHSETNFEEAIKAGHKEEKETGDIKRAGVDKSISEPFTEDIVPNHSTTTVNAESGEDNQEEVSGGSEIAGANKEIGETIKEGDALPDHSQTNIAERKNEEDFSEEKVTEDPEIVNADKNSVEPITKEVAISDYSEKTFDEEPIKDEDEKDTEELEIVGVDKRIREPIKEVVSDHSTTVIDGKLVEDSHEEKVSGGSELADTDKDIRETIKEEEVVPVYSVTTIVGEQIKGDCSEEKVSEDQEIDNADKNIVEPITGEVDASDYSTTVIEDGHEESKVIGGSQIASDETIGETSIEKDSVLAYSETTIKDEPSKDGHDDIKPTKKMDEPAEDSHKEKVSGGLRVAADDKDIGDIVKEEDVVDSKTTIKEEQTEDGHNEEKVNKELEIATVDKDIKGPVAEEAAFPDYITTVTDDGPEESKVNGESQIAGIEDKGEAFTEKEIFADESKTATAEEPVIDGHEEEMVKEELEIIGADETPTNPIIEEDGLTHSGTIINNDSNNDSIEESKVPEESQIIGQGKNIGESTHNSESTIGEEISEECHEEEKAIEDVEKDGADKDIKEPIMEEVVDPTYSTTITEDEPIETPPSIQVGQEFETVEDESAAGLSTASDRGKITKEDPQEDIIEPTKHGVKAKESDLSMESTSEEQVSTEKVDKVDSVEEEEDHKIHDVDSVIETTEREELPKDISEDLSNTTIGADITEVEEVDVKDGVDLHKVQETEQDENCKESNELLEGTSSLAPLVSEEKTNEEIVEEEKSTNKEIVDSQITPSDDSDMTQQVLEDPVNEIADVTPEPKVNKEGGEIPKEEVHNVEIIEMVKEPEITMSNPQEEKTTDEETTLGQRSETESIKLEGTDEPDSTELIETELEGQDQIHPTVVEHNTITSAQNEEVCAEPAIADTREESESAKERSPILEDVTSVQEAEKTSEVNHEEDKKDSSKPSGEVVQVSEILEMSGASTDIEEHNKEEKEEEYEKIQEVIDDNSIEEQTPRELSPESGTVSLEGQLSKESSQQAEVYEGVESVAARDDSEKRTMDTEQTKARSQEADGKETLGEEGHISTLESLDAFLSTETPVEEKTSTERSDEINTFTESLVSEKQVIDDNVTDTIVEAETLVADENEKKKSDIPVEASDVVIKSVPTDNESIPEVRTTSGKPSHDDMSEEEPHETSSTASDKQEFDTAEMKEKSQEESTLEDEIKDSLKSERNGDENIQVEEPVKIEEDPEMGVGGTEQKVSVSESDPLKLVSEPQVPDVVLDKEQSTEIDEFKDDNILEISNIETTSTGVNRETDGLEQNATLSQNVEAVDPCEEFPKETESADQDQCHQALPETEKTIFVKDEEIRNERDAVSADDHTVEESLQEEKNKNEDKNLEEVDTYLDAKDQKLDDPMSLEKPSGLASQIPTFNNEKIYQDSALVEKNVDVDTYLDAEDQTLDEPTKLENSSDLVSQIPTFNNEKIDQDSDVVEKKVKDIIESDIPVMNTEESSKKDQKNVEAGISRELIAPTGSIYQEKTIDNVPIAPSLGEETSVGDFGDGSGEESLQEGKGGDVIKNAICELGNDETHKSNEGTATTESETSPDEVPKCLENASDIQKNEKQILAEPDAPKESFLTSSSDNAYIESPKEGEEKGDPVNEEAAKLVNDEQFSESNVEKSTRDDTYKKAPMDGIFYQEVPEGSKDSVAHHNIETQIIEEGVLEEPNLIAAGDSSVQLTQQGEDVKGAGDEEVSTTLEPEKMYTGKEGVERVNDDSPKTNETSKNETVHEMPTSHDMVAVEEDVMNQEDFTKIPVAFIVEGNQKATSEEAPVQVGERLEEESVYAQNEQTHETIAKESDAEGRITQDASVPESSIELEKPADSVTVTMPMSAAENIPIEEELQTDNANVSSPTEAPRKQTQEKEGKSSEDEEMTYIKKGTNEESGGKTECEVPLVETSPEGMKTNELHIQEKSCANEEGGPQLLIIPETPDEPAQKQISTEEELIKRTDEKSSVSNIDVASFPIDVTGKSLQEDEVDGGKHGDTLGHDSKVNDAKYEADKEMNISVETNTDFKSSEDGASLSDLLIKSSNGYLQTDGQSEGNPPHYKKLSSNKALTIDTKDDEKTDQKHKDEEKEEDEQDDEDEHKKDDSGSDAPVMVEASKDIEMKTTPKKSHGILHGVGSKVKHSISKVKKAITGKSSPHKQTSPKS